MTATDLNHRQSPSKPCWPRVARSELTKIYSRTESGLGVLDSLLAGFVGDFQMALLEIAPADPSQCCETGRDVVRDGPTFTDN